MKFTCQQSELRYHVDIVTMAIASRPAIPLLSNILLDADKKSGTIQLTGFDLSICIQTKFKTNVKTDGRLLIPASLFSSILSKLDSGLIEVELDPKLSKQLSIKPKTGKYKITCITDTEEYPELPVADGTETVKIEPNVLVGALTATLLTCGNDQTKPILTGINFRLSQKDLTLTSTDGHRMGRSVKDIDNLSSDGIDITIPQSALRELSRMIGSKPSMELIDIGMQSQQCAFSWDSGLNSQSLIVRTIDGAAPKYDQLIPDKFIRELSLDRKTFISALERIEVLTKDYGYKMKLDITDKSTTVSSVSTQVGDGVESIESKLVGDPITIGCNIKYLIEGLKTLSSDTVIIKMNDSSTQMIVTTAEDENTIYLIMPLNLAI